MYYCTGYIVFMNSENFEFFMDFFMVIYFWVRFFMDFFVFYPARMSCFVEIPLFRQKGKKNLLFRPQYYNIERETRHKYRKDSQGHRSWKKF